MGVRLTAMAIAALMAGVAKAETEQQWGLALGARVASVPYVGGDNEQASDFVPYLFAETEYFRVEQMGASWRAWRSDAGELGVVGRYRFLDLPDQAVEPANAETFDFGLQWQAPLAATGYDYRLEWLSDRFGRMQGLVELRRDYQWRGLTITPNVGLRLRDNDFTTKYYALDSEAADAGGDLQAGYMARWQLWNDLYLYSDARLRYLGNSVYDLATVDDRWQSEVTLGLAMFNQPGQASAKANSSGDLGQHYWRLGHGWATPSNLGDMLVFNTQSDKQDNQLTSLFYGYRMGRELFDSAVDIYLTPGVVYHHESDVQETGSEYVLALKFYWTYDWPTRWRLGVAEGLSYVSKITWIERVEMEEKGYDQSKLMNYLDLSLDVNVGDLFNAPSFNDWWFGYSIHHRSAVMETATQFGNIKGGSNYQVLYLQWDF